MLPDKEYGVRPEERFTVMCLYEDCEVTGEAVYEGNGNYTGYAAAGGRTKMEELRGIEYFKRNTGSDLTYFWLGASGTHYGEDCRDLITMARRNGKRKREPDVLNTLDYIDAVVLIKKSPGNTPLEQLPPADDGGNVNWPYLKRPPVPLQEGVYHECNTQD
ncbi:MAG: hypothetical protein LUD76_11220 [Alistipes sp.]|nr:hypothetical protein [Alistipes sp.]